MYQIKHIFHTEKEEKKKKMKIILYCSIIHKFDIHIFISYKMTSGEYTLPTQKLPPI